jgi:hypothetical protein
MPIFAVIDTASENVLGEFASRREAEAFRSKLVAADGSAAAQLRIEVDDEADAPPNPQAAAGHG